LHHDINLPKNSLNIPKGLSESIYRRRTTTTWPTENKQKDKQVSTKHTHKTKDRRSSNTNPLRTGDELRCSGRVSSSCSTRYTRRIILVTTPVIMHERGKDREVLTTSGRYPWSFVTPIFHNDQPCHGGDRNTFEVMTSIYLNGACVTIMHTIHLSKSKR